MFPSLLSSLSKSSEKTSSSEYLKNKNKVGPSWTESKTDQAGWFAIWITQQTFRYVLNTHLQWN